MEEFLIGNLSRLPQVQCNKFVLKKSPNKRFFKMIISKYLLPYTKYDFRNCAYNVAYEYTTPLLQ